MAVPPTKPPAAVRQDGTLTLEQLLSTLALNLDDVIVLRHTFTAGGLTCSADLAEPRLLQYVRRQEVHNKVGKAPPRLWLNFIAEAGRRCRFLTAYENHGELTTERTDDYRFFDLRPSGVLTSLRDRLVIEWSGDTVNWAKVGAQTAAFPIVEIADRQAVPFPGFDEVLLTYAELQAVIKDSRYATWQAALRSVQGVYLIADSSSGRLYVGKADGSERILGRWTTYARDGHGGNVAMRELADLDFSQRDNLRFSILRVFGPSVPSAEIDKSEAHYKRALLTRQFGLNRN